jgi:hypothetical protein
MLLRKIVTVYREYHETHEIYCMGKKHMSSLVVVKQVVYVVTSFSGMIIGTIGCKMSVGNSVHDV